MGKLSGPYSVSVEVVVDLGDFSKSFGKACGVKIRKVNQKLWNWQKRVYCITSNGECSDQTTLSYQMQYFGAVVQLVRMPACIME